VTSRFDFFFCGLGRPLCSSVGESMPFHFFFWLSCLIGACICPALDGGYLPSWCIPFHLRRRPFLLSVVTSTRFSPTCQLVMRLFSLFYSHPLLVFFLSFISHILLFLSSGLLIPAIQGPTLAGIARAGCPGRHTHSKEWSPRSDPGK